MKKRGISMLLAICLLLGMAPNASAACVGAFSQRAVYTPGQFEDVAEGSAAEQIVKTGYELGLMRGRSETAFGVSGTLSGQEALIIACRLHSLYHTGEDTIERDFAADTLLESYQAYAAEHGLGLQPADSIAPITRAAFARLLGSALPDEALEAINTVEDDAIPDLGPEDDAAEIYRLYRAGVLTGSDEYGSFAPNDTITRLDACAIAARMADTSLRRTLTLNGETKAAYEQHQAELAAEEARRQQEAAAQLQAAVAQVRTIQVGATVLYDTGIYSGMYLSGRIGTVKAGTYAAYINYCGTYTAKILLPDGTVGWVPYSSIRISSDNYVLSHDYTTEQKEGFVNLNGYESKTDYLIWISLATQQVTVFRGSQGAWDLLHSFECCTGKNRTPTIGGVFEIYYRQASWDFGSYYVNTVVGFNGGHAFHTRTYVKSTGALLDPTIGSPASQGCIRMYDSDVTWLNSNMPNGTTVVVF